jgi:hypothetical protein
MKFRGLLIAAVLLIAALVTLYFTERRGGKTPVESKPEEKLFSVKSDDIQEITVTPQSGERVKLAREGGKWKIVEPRAMAADDSAVSSMASALGGLSVTDTIDEKPASLKDYGLEPPQATVQFKTKAGAAQALLLGQDTPTGSSVYAKTDSRPRVVTVASYLKSDFTKSLFDLRDKAALKFDTAAASRAWVENKSGKFELAKSEDRWQIEAPVQARADQVAASDLLRNAADARMQAIEAEEASPQEIAKFRLDKPEVVFQVQDPAGTHELRVSAEKDGKRHAKSSDQAGIFTVSSDLATQLGKALADIRNKDVFDMDTWLASRVEAVTPEARVALDKQGEQWKGSDPKKTINASDVADMLDKLKAIRASSYPAAAPPVTYGLDKPVLKVQAVWGDKKLKESVEVGQAGDKAYARRQGDPAIYEVPADSVKSAREAINKLK